MLSEAQLRLLSLPFPLSAHDFVYGKCYLIKRAIRTRLDGIDPAWELTRPEFLNRSGDVITLSGGLTIAGVTRHSVGTGIIQILDPKIDKTTKETIPPTAYEQSRMETKAYKSAARDLLPRCAVEFGLGEYLKDLPKHVTTPEKLAEWLADFPPHWALGEGGKRMDALIAELAMDRRLVAVQLEPGRRLARFSDTWLTEQQFTERLFVLAEHYGNAFAGEIEKDATNGAE